MSTAIIILTPLKGPRFMLTLRSLLQAQDFDRPSPEIALDLIYIWTGYRTFTQYVKFGLPQQLDPRPDIPDDENTFVPVTIDAQFDDRFGGPNGFLYRRIPLTQIISPLPIIITPQQYPYHIHEVVDQINAQLHTQFTMDDLLDSVITEPGRFQFSAAPTSLVWTGEYEFISIEPGTPPYLYPIRELDGLHAYSDNPQDPNYMPITTPYAGPSEERVLELMNTTNQLSYELGTDVILTSVLGTGPAGTNTTIRYTSLVPGKISGECYYNRLSLAVLGLRSDLDVVTIPQLPFTIHEILDSINAALGLDLLPSEVSNDTYTEPQSKYRLRIASNTASIAWIASSFDFAAVLENQRYTTEGVPRITTDTTPRLYTF